MTSPGSKCREIVDTFRRGSLISRHRDYRHMVSPLRPASCRFMPTCSQYAVEALTEYGLLVARG